MKDDPHNNILHNFQKDVIIAAVKESPSCLDVVQNSIGCDDTLKSNLSEKNSKISYETQIFLIG